MAQNNVYFFRISHCKGRIEVTMSLNQSKENSRHSPSLQMALLHLRWQQLRQLELAQTAPAPLPYQAAKVQQVKNALAKMATT